MPDRRLNVRTMFYAAIFIALVATFGVFRVVQATRLGARGAMRAVVVAQRDIPEGATIDRTALRLADWPTRDAPAGAFGSVDSVAGRVTRVPIFAGDPIVPGRLAPEGSGPGLEVKIAPGKRAMAVKIDDVAGLSGLIQPNSRVDVLVTLREQGTSDKQVAKLFMENMRVLSVGKNTQRDESGKPISATTATLEVTPAEAERLAVAMNQGSIQLVLRGYGDPGTVTTTGASSADVLAQLRAAAPPAAPPPRREERPARRPQRAPERSTPVVQAPVLVVPPKRDTAVVRVYRGGEVEEKKFAKPDSAHHGGRQP